MPPKRKGPKRRSPPPPPIRKQKKARPPPEAERPASPIPASASNPPVLMDAAQLQIFMSQGIAAAFATYEANRSEGTGISQQGSGIVISTQNRAILCTYKNFTDAKPLNFHGNEGVVGLIRWIEKLETVFRITSCPEDCKVKYATCTLLNSALTWWNEHARSMGIDEAYAQDWNAFKQMMKDEYCPRQEIQALEQELWNLTMDGSKITAYTSRFNELASLCSAMMSPESKKIERYVWGLASPVQGLVTASGPATFDSAKRLAYQLTEQCIRRGTMTPQMEEKTETLLDRNDTRESPDYSQEYSQQTPEKKQKTITVCEAITAEPLNVRRTYAGELPQCNKCNYHHLGACKKCYNCNQKGHIARFCNTQVLVPNPGTGMGTSQNCYGCGEDGHIKRNCPNDGRQEGDDQDGVLMIEDASP